MATEPTRTEIVEGTVIEIFALLGGGEGCKKTCPRCGGSGNYSYCYDYGTKCFKCHGRGYVIESIKTATNRAKRLAAEERERVRNGGLTNKELRAKKKAVAEREAREAREREENNGLTDYELGLMIAFCKERALAAKKAVSSWVGGVKERLTLEVEVTFAKTYETAYGETVLLIMKDSSGNVFKSWASGNAGWDLYRESREAYEARERNPRATIKGTVKDHEEYKGEKSTLLTRIALVETEEVAA